MLLILILNINLHMHPNSNYYCQPNGGRGVQITICVRGGGGGMKKNTGLD